MIVILSMALGVGLARYGEGVPLLGSLFGDRGAKTTTSPVVVEGIQRLDRLATVRWIESVVATKESGGSSLERFLTGEKILLVAAGEVEAGVDLASLSPDDVEVDGERATIRLPEPEILSSSLDEEKTGVYDRDQGLLRLRPDDELVGEARRDAEEDQSHRYKERHPGPREGECRRRHPGFRRVFGIRGGRVREVSK